MPSATLPQLALLSVAGAAAAFAANVTAAGSLASVCTNSHAAASLPEVAGIVIDSTSVVATPVYNYSVSSQNDYPDAIFNYCNVTFSYSHVDKNDSIVVTYWTPSPENFQNRYLSTGGGGNAINSGATGLAMGVPYGAVTGDTDGGFGSDDDFYDVALYANNSINYEEVYLFAYAAHHELAVIGKAFTKLFYNMTSTTKLYSYYQGCSEGGREGMSQVQRYQDQFDGSIIGAPALRYAFQQVQHLYASLVEVTENHFPAPCLFEYVVNQTIIACDPLDGLTDGVVARTDLCKLDYDISVLVGHTYSCAASGGSSMGSMSGTASTNATSGTNATSSMSGMSSMGGSGGSTTPAINGTITEKDIAVVKLILEGLHDSSGKRVYFTYQPSAAFDDIATSYNSTSGLYYSSAPSGIGGEWVAQMLEEQKIDNLASWQGITYDTLKNWCNLGLAKYYSDLNTAWPDLTPYYSGGGKIIHYHGESDFSIPTASSVRFFESVRSIMYPNETRANGSASLSKWYKLFLVPGGSHCSPNTAEPNGPWPQTNLAVMIDWVESGIEPVTLNATHLAGTNKGANAQICAWPNRPLYAKNGTLTCVYDQASYQTWVYDLNAILMPVY